MKRFDFSRYIIRVVKYLAYLVIVFALIVTLFSIMNNQPVAIESLFRPGTLPHLIAFLVVMSIIYPLFGYVKAKIYLTRPFEDNRDRIEKILLENRFVIVAKTETTIVFRHRSLFVRLLRMFEEQIILDFSDNPILLCGQRRDTQRLARMIEYAIRDGGD